MFQKLKMGYFGTTCKDLVKMKIETMENRIRISIGFLKE